MRVTDFSVDRPVSITMLVMIVMVVGGIAFSRLGVDMLPEIDYPTLSVMVRYPGAPSEEIETMVGRPYEGVLASVNGVQKITTVSQEDVCYLMVEFVWGTDLDAAAADIREAIALIEPYMPPDVEDPQVLKFNLGSMPQAAYAVTGMEDTVALRKLMTETVQDRLERIEGVAQAPFLGGRVEEIQVDLDRTALSGSGVQVDQVVMALQAQNLNLPAGRQIRQRKEVLLRTVGMFDSLDDIRSVAVGATAGGTPIPLGSVAGVRRGTRDVRTLVQAGGYEALMLMVLKESGANPLQVRQQYVAQLEELQEVLPDEIEFGLLFDMGRSIRKMGGMVFQNGLLGAAIAVLVMFLFLRSIRPTATIAVVIPLSLLATFIPIYAMGETLNMMTMGGLVLGVGMLVDNAVVVIENIFRHLEAGEDRHGAAREGAREVGMAIAASTFTTMVVFLPILFSQGMAGQLARGLAVTVAAALFSSLFVALTIVPMLASVFFTRTARGAVLQEGRRFRRFKERYRRMLSWCLSHRAWTLTALAVVVALSLGLVRFVGTEFMPPATRPILMARISFPVGTALSETVTASQRIGDVLRGFPDVETVGTQVGVNEEDAGGGMSETNPSGPHEAILFARLAENTDRQIPTNDRLQQAIRERLPEVEGMDFEFVDMSSMMGGSSNPVEVKIFGPELPALGAFAEQVASAITGIPGLVDVDTTLRQAKPERHIRIQREKAARYGLTVGQVARVIKIATLGTVATRYREGGDELDLRVRFREEDRDSEADLLQIPVSLPRGGTIPLGQLVEVEEGTGPVKIVRQDRSRVVSVVAGLEEVDLGEAMDAVQERVAPIRERLPQGYTMEFGGQYEDMQEAFQQLVAALVLAILMVYMVMASQFESFSHPFTIMFTMPLAFVGVVWIFFLTRTTLSVPTFIGVIMLAGIVVNNGIVLVDYVNQLRRRGYDLFGAALEGAATRLRPVLITSLTTACAMVPMALGQEEGSETMRPLALTIIGGLLAATAFTLVVVPVVYTLVDAGARRIAAFWLRLLHPAESGAEKPPPGGVS